jgi:Ca2+-binding RTX toxin-like protein
VTVQGGGGNDTLNAGVPPPLGGNLDQVLANLSFLGQAGADTLNINDNTRAAPGTYTLNSTSLARAGGDVLFDSTLETLKLAGGAAGNTIDVQNTSGAVSILAGSGNDVLNIATGGNLNSIVGPLTVDGQGGTDIATFDDSARTTSSSYVITASTVTRTAATVIAHLGMETLLLNAGQGNDGVNVEAIATGAHVQLATGVGDDSIFLGAGTSLAPIQGTLSADGFFGTDSITFNDSSDTSPTSILVDGGRVTINGVMRVTGASFLERYTFQTGSGADLVNAGLSSLQIFAFLGPGNDTFFGGSGNDCVFGSLGNDLLLGGGGNDSLRGETDNDTLAGQDGADFASGGAGDDTTVLTDNADAVPADGGLDNLLFSGNDSAADTLYVRRNGGVSEMFFNAPTGGSPTYTYPLASLKSVEFRGDELADTLTIDFSAGNPLPAAGATFDGESDPGDLLRIIGTDSADVISVGASQLLFSGTPISYSSEVEEIEVNGRAGDDTLTLTQALRMSPAFNGGVGLDKLVVNAGTYTFNADASLTTSSLEVLASNAASVVFGATQHLRALTLAASARASLTPAAGAPGAGKLLVTDALDLSTGTRLDLAGQAMVLDYTGGSPLSVIRGLIFTGAADSSRGIVSLPASPDRALGYREGAGFGGTFLGEPIDPTTVLVRATRPGDAGLDGIVDFNDLAALAQNYNNTDGQRLWGQGDFTYDGNVDFNDLAKLAQNYNTAVAAPPSGGATIFATPAIRPANVARPKSSAKRRGGDPFLFN